MLLNRLSIYVFAHFFRFLSKKCELPVVFFNIYKDETIIPC